MTAVQPRPSAVNMTLPAFAAERRRASAVDRYFLSAGRSAANPPHTAAAVDRRNRQTDGQTDGRPAVLQTLLLILCGHCQRYSEDN